MMKIPKMRKMVPYVVLLICLSLTVLVWLLLNNFNQKLAQERYQDRTNQIVSAITKRMEDYATVVRGGAALFTASDEVTRAKWRTYIEHLDIGDTFPGIQGVGFSKVIQPSELAQHIQQIRAEGFPDYSVWPAGERDIYTSIIFLEPFDERNQRAFGYDMFSEPVRRAAMEQARDTGIVSISGKVKLAQENEQDVQAGFLMYVPFYPHGMPTNSAEERRAALQGYVYSPFRIKDLMQGIFPERMDDIDFEIFDGVEVSSSTLMYDSDESGRGLDEESEPMFFDYKTIYLHGHQWTLYFATRPSFELASARFESWGILATGMVISLLAFFFVRGQENTRERALVLAQEMTSALRKQEEELRNSESMWHGLVNANPESVYLTDTTGIVLAANETVGQHLGKDVQEMIGANYFDLMPPEVAAKRKVRVEKVIATGKPVRFEDNRAGRFIDNYIHPIFDNDGKLIRLAFLGIDITERKRTEDQERNRSRILESLTSGESLASILDLIVRFTEAENSGEICSILLLDDEEKHLLLGAAPSLPDFYNQAIHGLEIGDGVGSCGTAAFTKQRVIAADVLTHPYWVNFRELAQKANLRSCWSEPILTASGQALGTYAIYHREPCEPDLEDIEHIKSSADFARLAIEHKQAEEKIRGYAEQYQVILSAELFGFWLTDEEGKLLDVNDVYCRLSGYTREELLKLSISDLEIIEKPEDTARHIRKIIETGTDRFESKHKAKDGRVFDVEISTSFWHSHRKFVVFISDITERKRAEVALSESESKYRIVADNTYAWEFWLNPEEQFIYSSPSCESITGYTADKFKAEANLLRRIIHPDDLPSYNRHRHEVIEPPAPGEVEFRILRPDGTWLWIEHACQPVFDDDGCFMGTRGSNRDITDRKQAEEELRSLNAELEQRVNERTQQLEQVNKDLQSAKNAADAASVSKSEFLASMSHELRTPLTGILGLSETLQRGIYGGLNDKQVNIIHTIEEAGKHLLNLINDILDLSKVEAGKLDLLPAIINVNAVCQASLKMVNEISSAKHQKLSFSQNPLELMMFTDPRRIKQILVNLLGNAVKFTPENGELGLEVTGDEEGDLVMFSVWDKGIGIAPENMDKLFKPFSQIDSSLSRSHTGTGLGLSLVQRLAQLHEGQVDVTSTLGQGSRFTVSIPWHKDKTSVPSNVGDTDTHLTSKPSVGAEKPTNLGTILLIDDNQINSELLFDFLTFQGYHVISAINAKTGLDLVSTATPDLILMDIQMPGMDGMQAIQSIRTMPGNLSKTPIIALTALAMSEDRQRCIDAGANDYLSKPVDLDGLHSTIKRVIETKK